MTSKASVSMQGLRSAWRILTGLYEFSSGRASQFFGILCLVDFYFFLGGRENTGLWLLLALIKFFPGTSRSYFQLKKMHEPSVCSTKPRIPQILARPERNVLWVLEQATCNSFPLYFITFPWIMVWLTSSLISLYANLVLNLDARFHCF